MALIPVFCDHCGTLFAAENFLGGDWRQVTFKDVGFGPCPVCHRNGRVLDGTYEFIGGAIRVLSAPAWSQEKLAWLAARIQAAQAGSVAAEAVVDEVTEVAPELTALVRQLLRQGWKAIQILVAVLAIVGFIQSQANPPADNEAIDKATQTILHTIQEHPIPGSVTSPSSAQARHRSSRDVGAMNPKVVRDRKRKGRAGKTYGQTKKRKKKKR